MTGELVPPRGAASSAPEPARTVMIAICVGVAVAVAFYAVLLFEGSLHGYDWRSHHYHYFDWVRVSLTRYHTLPLFMFDAWVTQNFLANAESPSLGPLVALLCVLPTGAYIKLLIVAFTAAGLAGMFFLLRDLEVAPPVAGFVAVFFAFGGFFPSHLGVGHHWAMGAHLLPGLLCLYRRAALGSGGALWLAAALNACAILGGQHQPFIWQNLVISLFALFWAIEARALFPLTRGALLLLATAGLGAVKLLPMLAEFADYDPTARIEGLPLSLVLSTLVGRGQHPAMHGSGVVYAHGSGWWEYAFYVGPLALAGLAVGVAAARRCWPMVAIGIFFFVLAVKWPAWLRWIDVWPWFEGLPVWRTQRNPSRFLFVALFAFSVVAAIGLQRVWEWGRRRWPRAAPALALTLTLAAGVDLHLESRAWQRAALGEELLSRDHRPRPLKLGETGTAIARLGEFAPNRLVYRVDAEQAAIIEFPLRYGKGAPEWRVDGLPAISRHGKLAVEVPPGERDIVMTYRPRYFRAGLGASAATLLAAGIALLGRVRRRRAKPSATDGT